MAKYSIKPATDKTPKQVIYDGDLCPKEVSVILNVSERTLMRWRGKNAEIAYSKYGKNICYSVDTINKYLSDNFYKVA